jgi:hypothetical protein
MDKVLWKRAIVLKKRRGEERRGGRAGREGGQGLV